MCELDTNIKYILTSKLKTDAVENLFSQIRSKGGNNFNPSVYDFNFIIAKIIFIKLIFHVSTFNYEPDNCSFILDPEAIDITSHNIEHIGNSNNEHENINLATPNN